MSDPTGGRPPKRRGGRGRGKRRPGQRENGTNGGSNGGTSAALQEIPANWEPGTGPIVSGILELTDRGGGFLRQRSTSYLPGSEDVFVPQSVISRYKLRPGDEVEGEAGPPRGGKAPALAAVHSICGLTPEACQGRPEFGRLSAMHPTEMLRLAKPGPLARGADITPALIDLLVPLGKGQRALVVAPAKAGKTTLLTAIARGIGDNHPDVTIFILLADERPEEVTEMEMAGVGEVIASSFDFGAERHVAIAEMTLERARRRVELGQDVVIILDSITRLARAYNNIDRGSGRTLSGGIGAEAMERPKKFFGSARMVDPSKGSGSLTIIATALIDTGSRADEVIFEEFKGTGNAEIVLSRELAERRIFPAIDLSASSTRREELLLDPESLKRSHELRNTASDLPASKAVELVREMLAR
ncbi:MAG: transcription termination factor Rho [Gemmatimonadales bacterium]|jgi:transcription termination factor Rho|nr:transcription termination factor Rho [Gemmatimonadales bacterium]MDZ4391019.1 transcription termination factor Rho [Gemmatimonadales bacterium]